MKVKFENCEVDVSEIRQGCVVMRYIEGCTKPAVYHVKYFVGMPMDTPTINLVVEDQADSYFHNSAELVWPIR